MIIELFDRFTKHVLIRFIISGGTSAFVDLFILYILNSVWHIHYLTSAILAFICAFGVSFTLHKFWTFKSHGESAHKQVAMYLATSLFGLCLNTLLMYIFVDFFHLIVLVAQFIVGIMVAFCSYFLSHKFVFKYKNDNSLEIDIK
jgi:putative flippase GtrA